MKIIPVARNIKPIPKISKKLSGSIPAWVIYPLTAIFVDVPISVQVPPRMEANATGIKTFEGLRSSFLHIPITGPITNAVTVVLFIKAESAPVTSIVYPTKRVLLFTTFIICEPTLSNKPVSESAPEMIKMDAKMIMKSLLKPSNASVGVIIPVSAKITSIPIVTISTENFSVAKRMMTTTSSPITKAISIVFFKNYSKICKRNYENRSQKIFLWKIGKNLTVDGLVFAKVFHYLSFKGKQLVPFFIHFFSITILACKTQKHSIVICFAHHQFSVEFCQFFIFKLLA